MEHIIPGSEGKPILLRVHMPEQLKINGVLVIVHGFKGFMDWGHFPLLAKTFVAAGIPVVQFNFSHNGTTPEHAAGFADLEAFGHNNYSKELYDLQQVLDFIAEHEGFSERGIDSKKIALLGHSRGGGISILTAAADSRVRCLITWASVSAFGVFFGQEILESWQKEGVIYSYNSRTQQQMPLYYQLYEDVLSNADRLNIGEAAAKVAVPWQIVHGTADATVPFSAAETLAALCPSASLISVEGGDHTLGGKHPWTQDSLPGQSQEITEQAIRLLQSEF